MPICGSLQWDWNCYFNRIGQVTNADCEDPPDRNQISSVHEMHGAFFAKQRKTIQEKTNKTEKTDKKEDNCGIISSCVIQMILNYGRRREVEHHEKRSTFSGKLGFVLSAAGASVGLGNIWRFPYLAAKYGGGIFLLVYIILALTFGFVLLNKVTGI